jgi:antirestriction protein
MNTTTTTEPKLFLTDYASYNNGTQFEFGHWVDLCQFSNVDEFLEYIENHFLEADKKSPLDSPREEIMFTDFEGFPKCFYSESCDKQTIEKLFEFISMDEHDQKMVEMYAEATGYNISNIELSEAQDAFHGTADSEADFAQRMAEDCGEIPANLPNWICIDWDASWNCSLRYDYNTATDEDGTIYFFLNH